MSCVESFDRIVYGPSADEVGDVLQRRATMLLPKDAAEIDDVRFQFVAVLATDETVSSAVVTCATYSGTDLTPSAFLSGAPVIEGTDVIQRIAGGVVGCAYHLLCKITTSKGRVIAAAGLISVVNL